MKALFAAAVVASLLEPARACPVYEPRFSIGVVDESTLPTRGSIYYIDHMPRRHRPARIPEPAGMRSWTTTRLSSGLRRIDYETVDGAVVEIGAWRDSYRLRFDAAWQPPQSSPRIVRAGQGIDHFACPRFEYLSIELDQPVAAVVVRWTDEEPSIHLPSGGPTIAICRSVEPGERIADRIYMVTAIRYDGSEVVIDGLPENDDSSGTLVAHALLLIGLVVTSGRTARRPRCGTAS